MQHDFWQGEAEPGVPYWWQALDTPEAAEALPDRCDLLVVGAGYAGLSAAIAAHDCGADVVVVDAGEPGRGASTRNGGMMGAHPRLGWADLAKRFGAATADALFAEARPALDWVRHLIEREGVACDLQQTGRIQLAWTPRHLESQRALVRHVREKSEVRIDMVERAELGREIETERYFGGIVFPEHCAIHPAKFHQGLLHAVRRRGIPVVGHARAEGAERIASGFDVATGKGRVRADKVVLCTNGYTAEPFRWHAARVFPLPSYIIATEELPANLPGHLAPGRRMMVETRARHSYFRLSPDGRRVIWGGRASMRDLPPRQAAARLRETMIGVWPELADAKITHVWTGNTGFSFNQMPHVGEDRGLHHAMGFSGSGTVMAPYLGAKAAYRAVGDPRGATAYADTTLRRHWLHPGGKPHFLKAADLWYRQWVDRVENFRAR
ncbi:NAD(P)/FAD-dependent oxidoreductase [Roseovarius sp. SYSU LYC5161]|uniref:NAD(P)/FAD-dependent oxidoreductase n=1 Tax=Roseovarius halophilus (ex Wu et al. 2025) TaxID=3376060 RepID=UPI00399AA892